MDCEKFAESPVGQLVPLTGTDSRYNEDYDHFAFVPSPLPEAVDGLGAETWTLIAEASTALGRLDQASALVPNPWLLQRPAIRREAISTSALEGTYAPFTDVLEADVDPKASRTPQVREILNYVEAAEFALASIVSRDLTVGFLCELQKILVTGTPADGPDAGRIREVPVLIGPEGCHVEEARFVPPPPGDLLTVGFRDWERWVDADHSLPPVLSAALAHYQFETLHPFNDGNGRIGRLAVVLFLIKKRVLRVGLLTISPWLEARRRDYQDHLLRVSQTGNWEPWVAFFCEAVRSRCETTVAKIQELLALKEDLLAAVHSIPLRGVAVQITEDLIGQPVVTATYVAEQYGVTFPAANTAIRRLTSSGVLTEMTGRTYGRIFACERAMELIQKS